MYDFLNLPLCVEKVSSGSLYAMSKEPVLARTEATDPGFTREKF